MITVSRNPGEVTVRLAADLADPAGWDMLEAAFGRELATFTGGRVVLIHAAAAIGPIGFAGETDRAAHRASVLLNAAAPPVGDEQALRGQIQVLSVAPGVWPPPYISYCALPEEASSPAAAS